MKRLSIVVPVYFNEASLPILFERMKALEIELASRAFELELVFVDDGSRDGSFGRLMDIKRARPATKVVRLTRNFGAVHASKCGLGFVTGDCFAIVAADLQDPPELILRMVDLWISGRKFVVCARASRDDPWTSKVWSAIYYRLLNLLVIRDYPRGGYDMALMDAAMLPPLRDSSKNLFTPLLAYWLGYRPEVIEYHRPRREHGRSGWTFRKKFKAFLDVMLGFSVTPIRLISGVGLVVAMLSFAYGTSVVINALLDNVPVAGFSALAALITFLLGLIIVMLGVIGEYLWRVFDEVNRRPEVVIDEVH